MSDGKPLPVKFGKEGEIRVPGPNDVVVNGMIVGTDPDPAVRAQIARANGDETQGAT